MDQWLVHMNPRSSYGLATLRAWYRAPKTPESRKYEKITKKNTKSPFPGWGPKIRKNYRKNTKMDQKSPFLYFFGHFFVFSGPDPGRGILLFFSRNFFVFSGFRGFCNLYQARRVANLDWKFSIFGPLGCTCGKDSEALCQLLSGVPIIQNGIRKFDLGTPNAEKENVKKEMVPDRFSKQSFKILKNTGNSHRPFYKTVVFRNCFEFILSFSLRFSFPIDVAIWIWEVRKRVL